MVEERRRGRRGGLWAAAAVGIWLLAAACGSAAPGEDPLQPPGGPAGGPIGGTPGANEPLPPDGQPNEPLPPGDQPNEPLPPGDQPNEPPVGNGATYYLSPAGSDANPGTSPEAPWRTLRKAAAVLEAGDTLLLRGGEYASDYFQPVNSGTRENPITIRAYPNEIPVITGDPTFLTYFNILGKSWIVIDGLHFRDTTGGTLIYTEGASHLFIRNCTFRNHGGATMINIGRGGYNTIEYNTFDTTGDPDGAGEGNHIYLRGSDYNLIQHNYFTRAGHDAIDLINYGPPEDRIFSEYNVIRHNTIEQHWGGGIGLVRGTSHTLVEHNAIYYAGEQVVAYPKVGIQIAAERNIVRHNVVAKTSARPFSDDGLAIYAYTFAGLPQHARDNRIYNNVVYKAGRAAVAMNQKDRSVNTRNRFVNNIFYFNRVGGPHEAYWPAGNYYLTVETYHAYADNKWPSFANGNTFFHNLFLHADAAGDHPDEDPLVFYDQENWGRSLAWVEAHYPEHFAGNVSHNPRFVDAEGGDFRLQVGSPLVDAGAHLTKTTARGVETTVVPVDDPYPFTDGFGIVAGDPVRIGANPPVRIVEIDYQARTLTVDAPVSFGPGDPVDLPYAGAGPDIGLYN